MITYPKVTPGRPDTGLLLRPSGYSVSYYENGKRKWQALGTSNVTVARQKRSAFYTMLANHRGAKPVVPGRPAARKTPAEKVAAAPDSDIYLRRRSPWVAVVGGKVIAEGLSKREVRAARNAVLLSGNDPTLPPATP